jgi:hypothetical protein
METLDEERRDALEGVLESLAEGIIDRDHAAAGARLLSHLRQTYRPARCACTISKPASMTNATANTGLSIP